MFDYKSTWKDALEVVRVSVSPAIFSTWFTQTHIIKIEDRGERATVELGCSTSFVKNFIETRYLGLVQDSLVKTVDKPVDLVFTIKDNPDKNKQAVDTASPLFQNENNEVDIAEMLQKANIRRNFTFDNFAVSGSNQMAHAAALAVADSLGTAYNPLFIYGGVGVGKTHLMAAVAYTAIKRNQSVKALFCTGESFTNDIIEGIRNKTTQNFRDKYRKLNLLMIDDIQFIAGKDTAQEEFFHTFNAVTLSGGQVILTSDRPPSEISRLEERLRSRFEAGLIVDISPPDFELRCAITQIKVRERGLNLTMEQIQMIAANVDSARKIEGALIKLITLPGTIKTAITNDSIEKIISHGVSENGGVTIKKDPAAIVDSICNYYQIGKRSLLSNSRLRGI